MVEVSLIKLPSWNCLQINVTVWNLTEKNPTLVQVHLMTWCLYYTVVKSDSGCRPVGNQSAISWGAIGDRSATVYWVFVFDCRKSATFWRSVGNRSAISRRLKSVSGLSATAATGRRSVANQSATSRQSVGDHQKPFYDRFGRREVSLAATKTSLRPNRPCNLLQPVGDQSPTSLQTPCNLPATTRNFGRKEVADRLQAMCVYRHCDDKFSRVSYVYTNNTWIGDIRKHDIHTYIYDK